MREVGPTRLWAAIEIAWHDWTSLGTPACHEFGLTAIAEGDAVEHRIWLRDPDKGPQWRPRWTLPAHHA